ncbi:MAG: glycine cleavage system protein GcvH [Gaiellaceae bacterium MAG52_C11]|nr:glycine cleavage system protein GcvH [Candidatus Gaiellasilicea maunaloa]
MTTPSDRRYTPEHQWIRVESASRCLIGVTDFAQSQLGEISFVDVPATGSAVRAGEPFGTIESLKAASDLFAPVSGEIVGVNGEAGESPERINDDPYGVWLIAIAPSDPGMVETLLTADQYDALVAPTAGFE